MATLPGTVRKFGAFSQEAASDLYAAMTPGTDIRLFNAKGDGVTDDSLIIQNAINAIPSTGGSLFFPAATYVIGVGATLTVPINVTLQFAPGAIWSIAAGRTVTINGTIQAADQQIFAGTGSIVAPNTPQFRVRWFGALGNDTGDDGPAIQAAVNAAQNSRIASVIFGAGIFRVATTVTITGSNKGITILGNPLSALQQGSQPSSCQVHWVGGASPVFSVGVTYVSFQGFAIIQDGSTAATYAIQFTVGGRNKLTEMSFLRGQTGTAPHFSVAAVAWTNGTDYSLIERHCEFESTPGVLLANNASSNLTIRDCVFNAQSNGGLAFITVNHSLNVLRIEDTSFIMASADGIVLDTTGIGAQHISSLILSGDDYDVNVGSPNCRLAKLKNVNHALIAGMSVHGQGNANPLVELTNSRATIAGNYLLSITTGFAQTLDTLSQIFVGPNWMDRTNVASVLTPASIGNLQNVTVAANVARMHGELMNPAITAVFRISAADNSNFQIQAAQSADGDPGFFHKDQVYVILIRNVSGGAMGTVTFQTAFKTSAAFTSPANGFSRAIYFYYDGTNHIELQRGQADVSN